MRRNGRAPESEVLDVAVVGAGFGGLSAAIGLRRHRLATVVFDGGPPRNAAAAEVHGYLGSEGLSALELRARGRTQAAELGAQLVEARICAAERLNGGFRLEAEDGRGWAARRVVLATGVRDRMPDIDGIDEFYGRSLHVCPHCDAFEWRDRRIAVISWTPATRDFALRVSHWSPHVTVVSDGRQPRLDDEALAELEAHGIGLLTADIERLEGRAGLLEAVRFADGGRLEVEAAFFNLGQVYNTELAEQLGCQVEQFGPIEVDRNMHTTAEGVWAIGDVAGDSQFVAVAVAHGTRAAIDVYRTLSPTEPNAKRP